jgi:hypothetical protein
MAAVGLKGIWGLEQLDKTGIATWKLGLMLMGSGVLLGTFLSVVLGDVNPASVLASTITPTLTIAGFLIIPALTAATLWLILMTSRTIEADLLLLPLTDDASLATMKQLRPRKKTLFTQAIVFSLLITTVMPGVTVSSVEVSISEAFGATYTSGLALSILFYLLVPIMGLVVGVSDAFSRAQQKSLQYAARHIEIDLLRLDDYSVIANPAVRLALFSIAVLSVYPLFALFSGSEETGRIIWPAAIPPLLLCVGGTLGYGYPVLILRNRIRDMKKLELDKVYCCLQGDKEAISTIRIQGLGAPTTTADLLIHQMFLNSLWEWPIASHVQKLLLFGLLPPFTWVLAAGIENLLY